MVMKNEMTAVLVQSLTNTEGAARLTDDGCGFNNIDSV